MPVKIDNLSGLSFNEDVEFNEKELEEISLFNGYPVDTEVFPSSSDYIWTFYTGSSRERFLPEGHFSHYDLKQPLALNTEWVPSGWYGSSDYHHLLNEGYNLGGMQAILRKWRIFQIENRLGIGSDESADNLLSFLSNATDGVSDAATVFSFDLSLTSSIYEFYERPSLGGDGWVNGHDAVLNTTDSDGNDLDAAWQSFADPSVGVAMGGQSQEFGNPGQPSSFHKGTPTDGTGPAGGVKFKDRSALNGDSGEIIVGGSATFIGRDRFLHVEDGVTTNNTFTVVRTPQRIFNNTPATTISRKFVGFYYHAYSRSNALETMANTQIYNGDPYLITVWATPYHQTSQVTRDSFTHQGVTYDDGPYLITEQPGIIAARLQPAPTFLGGVKLSDIGNYVEEEDFDDRHWSEFPTSGSDWKPKVLEIPDEALTDREIINVKAVDGLNAGDPTFGTKRNSLYIYFVFGPPASDECDIAICQCQIAEFDSALVPQSVLSQLE